MREYRRRKKLEKLEIAERSGRCKPPRKTAAERMREYRERKKLKKLEIARRSGRCKPPRKTAAERMREYRERKKLKKLEIARRSGEGKHPRKTAAERMREYRERKRLKKLEIARRSGAGKPPRKTAAERMREYRERKRLKKLESAKRPEGDVTAIQREEEKVKRSLKEAAKKGDKDVCKILAKEIIRARKSCNKIYTSKAHLNSVSLQMKNQLATIRVAGSVSKSTEVMQAMQSLVRVPEVAATMREMSKEMMKAGIIEEMLDETMDSIEDSEDMEDEADEEVDKILWEVTAGQLGTAPAVITENPGIPSTSAEEETKEDDKELEEMKNRLQSLRS